MTKLFCCVAMVVAACAVEGDETTTATATSAIANGTIDTGDPSVVAVRLFPGGATESGVLIGQRTVLTVAHGFTMNPNTTQVRVYFGQNAFYYDRVVDVQSWTIHPSYTPVQYDMALLYLSEPVTDRPIARLNRRPASSFIGSTLRLVGFGYDGNGGGLGTKRTGTATLAYTGASPDPTFGYTAAPSLNDSGDSGGPVFLTTDGIEVVAGVMSGANSPNGLAADVYAALPAFIEPWLIDHDQTGIDYDCANIVANEGTCAGNVLTYCNIVTGWPESLDCGASYPNPQGCGIVNTSWRNLPVSGCTDNEPGDPCGCNDLWCPPCYSDM